MEWIHSLAGEDWMVVEVYLCLNEFLGELK